MDLITGFLSSLFWGLITLSFLVFIHEGGHFLAARACGVRVTEFFLGLPCRFNIHHVSKRIGTKFGVTPILLGGYAAVCGMDEADAPCAPTVLAAVHRHGRISTYELAQELHLDETQVQDACAQLLGWGSLAADYAEGEDAASGYYPDAYAAMPRDAAGNTVFDGKRFDRAHATGEGEPWEPTMGERAFFEQERSRTYAGLGFWRRALILIAGIAVNVVCGILLIMSVYSLIGIDVPVNTNELGAVAEGSPAQEAGLMAGDVILSVDGIPCETWNDVVAAIDASTASDTEPMEVVFERDGVQSTCEVTPLDDGTIGITVTYMDYRLNPIDSFRVSASYVAQTVDGIVQLLTPTKTLAVLDQSTSVVGISVLSSQAAANGPTVYLPFAGLISLSLGFMNLLPIPPLDGGKLVLEAISAVIRRKIPPRVQLAISYVGIALFGALFLYVLRVDILRFI